MDNLKKAKVKSTGELINVYRLISGNYYDYDNMSEALPPSAVKAGKKEFAPNELIIK